MAIKKQCVRAGFYAKRALKCPYFHRSLTGLLFIIVTCSILSYISLDFLHIHLYDRIPHTLSSRVSRLQIVPCVVNVSEGGINSTSRHSLHDKILNVSLVDTRKTRDDLKYPATVKNIRRIVKPYHEYKKYFGAFSTAAIDDRYTNRHAFEFLMNNENACSGETFLVSIVHSAPNNSMKRDLIRQTWGSYKNSRVNVVRPVFLLGQVNDSVIQEKLIQESRTHHDIVQGNFYDSYKNLTYKNIMGLHWLVHYCNRTKFVLKVDDDVIVNINRLVTHLTRRQMNAMQTPRKIVCFIFRLGRVHRVGKWGVSSEDYPYDRYPSYCQGFAYLMTVTVARDLYEASVSVKHLWIDDIFVTGLLAEKARIQLEGFAGTLRNTDMRPGLGKFHISTYGIFVCRVHNYLGHWKIIWTLITSSS